jgi:hypothetical protein
MVNNMILVHKHDLDPKLNLEGGLKRGDKVEIEIADVSPMGIVLDPKTLKLHAIRDLHEQREPLVKPSKSKATMPLPDLKNMIQPTPPAAAPVAPPMPPAAHPMPPVKM